MIRDKGFWLQQYLPFTVLKQENEEYTAIKVVGVATVLTVYGIETEEDMRNASTQLYKLQQYLPFTVLKLQYKAQLSALISPSSCNSTYRLRY